MAAMSWEKMIDIAKRAGIKAIDKESLKKAIDQGFVPESIFHKREDAVHRIDGKEMPAADENTDPKMKEQINADLKERAERAYRQNQRDPVAVKEVPAEENALDYSQQEVTA